MAEINFGGVVEKVVTRDEFPLEKAREVMKDEVFAVLGYGVQGPAQAFNLKDNGFKVIIGQSKQFARDWDRAASDGWIPGENLFETEEAVKRGTVIMMLVSDAAQMQIWPEVKKNMKKGCALYFSHGFTVVYKDQTHVIPPEDVDVILVAPKGSGTSVRRNFLSGSGINSSYAIFQDYTGRAADRCIATGIGIGSGYLFPTTFEKEVWSDLTGERGVLMGALAGMMEAQYQVLRENGHTPSEAFNESVEELTQSLIRLVDEKGMDWMYSNCSATAQRGALDWRPVFKETLLPVFNKLYKSVKVGDETAIVISRCGKPGYQSSLNEELSAMRNSEMWQAGAAVRSLRPKEKQKDAAGEAKGTGGREGA